jgi:hypothetical protein
VYNLYRFDAGTSPAPAPATQSGARQAGARAAPAGRQSGRQRAAGPVAAGRVTAGRGTAGQGVSGSARIPGLLEGFGSGQSNPSAQARASTPHAVPSMGGSALRAGPRNARVSTKRYVSQLPSVVTTDFVTTAKTPLLRSEPLYQDVAHSSGIRWELLAACDWMQCKAHSRLSPVHGEKLGTRNPDGTVYRTKSDALAECARDLVELARAVYRIDLAERIYLSVRDLAKVFAAFRWGGLLNVHHVSPMEFPYSVAGLTAEHMKMRWPDIRDPNAPDKPGSRFRMSFGAVPVVLALDYPAVA